MSSPDTAKPARWKRVLGYVAFTLFSFLLCLYLTFPYDVVERLVKSQAEAAGYTVKMGSLGPGLFGITARKVQLMRRPAPGEEPDVTEALVLDSVALRPALFPPGLALSADALGGTIRGSVGVLGDTSLRLVLDGLNPKAGNFKAFTGVDLDGRINGRLSLDVPKTTPPGAKEAQPDLGAANGLLTLDLDGLQVNGGTLKGDFPLDLPKAALGNVSAKVKFEKGTGTVETLEGTGDDLKLGGEGTITLARRLESSQLNLLVRLKASPEFVKNSGLVGSGLSFLPADKTDPTFRAARVAGPLAKPAFLPAR